MIRIFFLSLAGLFVSTLCVSQTVKPYAPELFSPKVSGAVCGFSPDGKIIYFVREDTIQKKLFVYQANRIGKKWSQEKLMSFSGANNDYGGRLSPDGKTFYFTSDRPNGSSLANDAWNIWTTKLNGGTWSAPEPIKSINDKGNECCPVPLKDGSLLFSGDRGKDQEWWMYSLNNGVESTQETLTHPQGWQWPSYFDDQSQILFFNSMKRKDTKGMDDVYFSLYQNSEWTTPVNIGEPVNTKVYEDGAILSPDKKFLIFCRHETGATPSQVVCTEWKPLLKRIKKA